jgi:hypothetical protein
MAGLRSICESGREEELRQISANSGRWPAPNAAEVAHERDLSAEQARWLAERFVGHPGRTVSEPVVLKRPLAEQRATYVACTMGGHSDSEEVAAMREEPNWTFRGLEAGHCRWCRHPRRSWRCSTRSLQNTAAREAVDKGDVLNAGDAARAGRREWIGLAVIALPCLLLLQRRDGAGERSGYGSLGRHGAGARYLRGSTSEREREGVEMKDLLRRTQ